VKEVKSAFGVTVNDVVLALCTGALRAYLDEQGELPAKPLVAGVPVSTRRPEGATGNNSVSNMFTALPVHLADPVERLRSVHEVTKGAKEQFNLLGVDMLSEWLEVTPPKPYAAFIRLYGRLGLADRHRPPINLIVSNVPGPQEPLYIAGARLEAIYSVGPILENVGLNVTMWSYLDSMNFGIIGVHELALLKKAAAAA
jgi:diacylglycerol O-acyltransferase / wax synthase